jgi:hypothetical protein
MQRIALIDRTMSRNIDIPDEVTESLAGDGTSTMRDGITRPRIRNFTAYYNHFRDQRGGAPISIADRKFNIVR